MWIGHAGGEREGIRGDDGSLLLQCRAKLSREAGYALSDWTAEVAAIWATWEDSSLGLPHHVGQLGAARGTSPRDMFTQGVRHPLDKHDLSRGYYNEKEWIDKANAGEIRPQKRSLQPGNPGVK